ncbi:MAG: GlsB/YeaQ/YmgE family stress response membrane protein [Actinomycetes bacterium]
MEISGIVSGLVVGLVIGALGRLVVPGRQPLGCLLTVLLGILGAALGTLAGGALDVGEILTFALQVLAAAALVAMVSLPQRRR